MAHPPRYEGRLDAGFSLPIIPALSFLCSFFVLLLVAALPAEGETPGEGPCQGRYKGGIRPSPKSLLRILEAHKKWIEGGRRADQEAPINLCEANLKGLTLRNLRLWRPDFSGADLEGANLIGAQITDGRFMGITFKGADLRGAQLLNPDLTDADLSLANLSGARLTGAVLVRARMRGAVLTGAFLYMADLSRADLEGADLAGADLTGAELYLANLDRTILDARPGSFPRLPGSAAARNLSRATYRETPIWMAELREQFRSRALWQQERELTFAIKRTQRIQAWDKGLGGKFESAFNLVAFEWTCGYGLFPGRPVKVLLVLIPAFALFYTPFIFSRQGRSGIWIVRPSLPPLAGRGHAITRSDRQSRVRLSMAIGIKYGGPARLGCTLWSAFRFSFQTAFSIGWRDINIGNWLSRMQCREYTLQATGLPRFISGVQSPLSVYLLVLAILSYFSRLF